MLKNLLLEVEVVGIYKYFLAIKDNIEYLSLF